MIIPIGNGAFHACGHDFGTDISHSFTETLDLDTLQWTRKSDAPVGSRSASFVYDGKRTVFMIGGFCVSKHYCDTKEVNGMPCSKG